MTDRIVNFSEINHLRRSLFTLLLTVQFNSGVYYLVLDEKESWDCQRGSENNKNSQGISLDGKSANYVEFIL